MTNQASKSKTFKLVMSIMIPLLIVVTTVVMVGASFAWFTNADKVTVTEITMSTAESYRIDFNLQTNESLWDNMQYVGQTAFCDNGTNAGKLMTKGTAGNNTVNISNRPYYFINTVALDTTGKTFDMSMAFDTASILKYTYKTDEEGKYITDKNGNYVKDNRVEPTTKKEYGKGDGSNSSSDISYVFTWFFKEHVGMVDNKILNYYDDKSGDNKTVRRLLQLEPAQNEVWYTPYGKLTFGSDGLVASVNGDTSTASSIKGVDGRNITNFSTYNSVVGDSTSQLFDFYVVFAPEKLFWMQFFSADKDKYTASEIYTQEDETKKIFENLNNQIFYSSMDYSGSTFEFSAVIHISTVHEEAQG